MKTAPLTDRGQVDWYRLAHEAEDGDIVEFPWKVRGDATNRLRHHGRTSIRHNTHEGAFVTLLPERSENFKVRKIPKYVKPKKKPLIKPDHAAIARRLAILAETAKLEGQIIALNRKIKALVVEKNEAMTHKEHVRIGALILLQESQIRMAQARLKEISQNQTKQEP